MRIAVLAALNLADEGFRLRSQLEEAENRARARAAARAEDLARQLAAALGE
jgi:cell division protein ZapA (FtsZ GTPase activity inhibitor)